MYAHSIWILRRSSARDSVERKQDDKIRSRQSNEGLFLTEKICIDILVSSVGMGKKLMYHGGDFLTCNSIFVGNKSIGR